MSDAFRTTLDLFSTGLDLMRQNLKRQDPEANEDAIDLCLAKTRSGSLDDDFRGLATWLSAVRHN